MNQPIVTNLLGEETVGQTPFAVLEQKIDDTFFIDKSPRYFSAEDKVCLARNIYFEAGVEDEVGKIAVGQVTLNRLSSGRWGNTVCKVVWAKAQFSWTLFKKTRTETPSGPLWEASQQASEKVIEGLRVTALKKSLFYHTDYVKVPAWASVEKRITQIGQHIFYTTEKVVPAKKKKSKKSKKVRT